MSIRLSMPYTRPQISIALWGLCQRRATREVPGLRKASLAGRNNGEQPTFGAAFRLVHPRRLKPIVQNVRVDVSALGPGDGPASNCHGTERGRITAGRLEHRAVEVRLKVDLPLRAVVEAGSAP